MTMDEATVCMNKAFPVVVSSTSHEWMNEGTFTITAINRCFQSWCKKSMYSAQLTRNKKHYYSLDIESLEVAEEYEDILEGFVEQLKRKKLKVCIKELIAAGGNKTTITKLIKELIDEIKKE